MLCMMTPAIGNIGKPRITLRIVFEHILHMEQRLTQRIDGVEQRLTKRIDGVESSLTQRIDKLERKVDRNHIQISAQIDALDKRLDDLEVVQIPTLKRAIGSR